MIGGDACFTHEQTAATNKPVLAVDPNVEVLARFASRQPHMKTLHNTTALRGCEEESSQEHLGARLPVRCSTVRTEKDYGGLGHSNPTTSEKGKPSRGGRD